MRLDARNLLEKLGKNDFAYREFEDRFTELELWPILEALLRDPRLQAIDQAENAAAAPPAEPEEIPLFEGFSSAPTATASAPVGPDAGHQGGESLSSLFSRYGTPAAAAPAIPSERRGAQAPDVRAMLRHLSDLGSRGEI